MEEQKEKAAIGSNGLENEVYKSYVITEKGRRVLFERELMDFIVKAQRDKHGLIGEELLCEIKKLASEYEICLAEKTY